MKTTSNYTEYVKKIVELMNVLDEEDKKVVVVYAGALRDRALLSKKDPDNLEASQEVGHEIRNRRKPHTGRNQRASEGVDLAQKKEKEARREIYLQIRKFPAAGNGWGRN